MEHSGTRRVALSAENLSKRYGPVVALNEITFNVLEGEIFGILGPNGAGKTTLIETLIGIRHADSGSFTIMGLSGPSAFTALRSQIGVVMQSGVVSRQLRVRELVAFYLTVYNSPLSVDSVLECVGLQQKASAIVGTLSGGQQRRFIVALAIIGNPRLLFVDEPTANLDPHARRVVWDIVTGQRRDSGCTVILTTNQMDEAQTLCDRVAIIDGGEIVALDTPRGLVEKYCPEKEIVFRSASYHDFSALAALAVERTDNSTTWRVPTNDVEATLASISQVRGENDTGIETLRVDSATLEDVFLHLTGHRVRE